jgi:hypothetical protein
MKTLAANTAKSESVMFEMYENHKNSHRDKLSRRTKLNAELTWFGSYRHVRFKLGLQFAFISAR